MDLRTPPSPVSLANKIPKPNGFLKPHPNHDYYTQRFSFPILVYFTLCCTAAVSALLLVALKMQDIRPTDFVRSGPSETYRLGLAPLIPALMGYLGFCILLSLVFEITTPRSRTKRYGCRLLHFCIFTVILLLSSFSFLFTINLSLSCTALYLMMSIVHACQRWNGERHAVTGLEVNVEEQR